MKIHLSENPKKCLLCHINIYAHIMTRFSWGNIQERDHTNVAIVFGLSHKYIKLRYNWEYTLERCHTHVGIMTKLFFRAAISNFTWRNIQETEERDHINVAIVKRISHKNIIFRYTQICTLGRSHTCANIVTRLFFWNSNFKHHMGKHTGEKYTLYMHLVAAIHSC